MKCHSCGAALLPGRIHLLRRLVSSDCQPQEAELLLGACDACGLVQKENSSAWGKLCDRIYSNYRIYYQAAGKEQKVRSLVDDSFGERSVHLTAFLATQGRLPRQGRIIDVGCGNGAFLRSFKSGFPDWQVGGAEINATFAEEIRAIAPDACFYEAAAIEALSERFDVVTLIHCLEHIPAPTAYLKGLKRLFGPQSLLMIEVPDAEKNPFDLLIADHASHFNSCSLRRVVEAAGFDVRVCGNVVLGKEITLLATPTAATVAASSPARTDYLEINLAWLMALEVYATKRAAPHSIGIFGSSIAGTWLGKGLGDRLAFFVDEDPDRVGNSHLGVPILAPQDVPVGATVFVALEPRLARTIGDRLSQRGINAVTPAINTVRST